MKQKHTPGAPYRAPANLTERCARAEALAERLAAALEAEMAPPTAQDERTAAFAESMEAVSAWTAHRADLETLALNGAQSVDLAAENARLRGALVAVVNADRENSPSVPAPVMRDVLWSLAQSARSALNAQPEAAR